jgi:bacteriocin biosynthesis cyclodehydratase domain-containing protein
MIVDLIEELDGDAAHPQSAAQTVVRLRSGLHVLPHGFDEIFVREGARAAFSKVIKDPRRRMLLARLVQLTTEPVTAIQLAELLEASVADTTELVDQLVEAGVVAPVTAPPALLSVLLVGDGRYADYLRRDLAELDHLNLREPTALLSSEEESPELDGVDLVVVATDHLRPALNHEVNAACHEAMVPVLFSYIDGSELTIGPLVVPGDSACYLCFDMQDEGARHLRDEYLIYKNSLDRDAPVGAADRATAVLAAGWATMAVAKYAPADADFLVGRILRVETSRMEVMAHRILQIPRCPVCSAVRPDLEHTFL